MNNKTGINDDALGFAPNIEEFTENFKQCEELMQGFAKQFENMDMDPLNLNEVYGELFAEIAKDPEKLVKANIDYWQSATEMFQNVLKGMSDKDESTQAVIEPAADDKRFRHESWQQEPVFDMIKQSYLLSSKWTRDVISDHEGLDEDTSKRVEFFTERFLDALSPTNFAATNPAVLEKIVETNGESLFNGMKSMMNDLDTSTGQLKTKMTDTSAFELGENVATTPGKVVFENRMMQLLQYTPSTKKVAKRPLLVVPPWINKFYILDLQPKNSLIKWLVDQGHTVFVISWINPDESYRETGFDDYVSGGPLAALDAIEQATGEKEINAIGYCIGGTLLATTLAYMKEKNDKRIKSATFLTSMLDFSEPGDLGVFINESQMEGLDKKMDEKGFLDGKEMAGTFNMMRANDLIWSFYINNYLLGNDPRPFDLLYWNSDSTRMPAAMHSWYIKKCYIDNALCKPDAVTVLGESIDFSKIDTPSCFVSTIDDHIAPWLSTYQGAQIFSGPVQFILGGSGHIAGIINPPEANKYGYQVTKKLPADPVAWAEKAKQNEGSWWSEWQSWVKPKAGAQVDARKPGDGKLKVLEDAPGSYVKSRIA